MSEIWGQVRQRSPQWEKMCEGRAPTRDNTANTYWPLTLFTKVLHSEYNWCAPCLLVAYNVGRKTVIKQLIWSKYDELYASKTLKYVLNVTTLIPRVGNG